ncbi:outer membrane protein OmpA-like peptidoglycan-associated protein [Murinocardiopsis flavida]|uniref:Outer membrane protein OmpA-like peptidoglycan-associated protein n=1 Tax=Murinocardiopsis flavida TaxID=645275 RepID=A0A2P8DHW0_9ACTN|nr:OmpA family protein [Murinocardiopsis flavida]PSK96796.1 outer membrane protein OmpA-like peptidoglycan-associated protein [Murinocardiopsis flavida]
MKLFHAAPVCLLALALTACGTLDRFAPDGKSAGGDGAAESSPSPSAAQAAPDADPADCTGDSVFIEAVEIAAVRTAAVQIPEIKDKSGTVLQEAGEIPGVSIPAQRVPAQCAEVAEAPGGCLGAVEIPGAVIPAVRIPSASIPGLSAEGVSIRSEAENEKVLNEVKIPGKSEDEVCQEKPTEAGERVSSVRRSSVYRSSERRPSLSRPSLRRPSGRAEDGTRIPAIEVPRVVVPSVKVPSVKVESDRIESRRAGETEVLESDGAIAYNLDSDVLFDSGSHELKDGAVRHLKAVGEHIGDELPDDAEIAIEGHTDSVGSESENQDLSERRAETVLTWLVDDGGVDKGRLKATGYGESRPAVPNKSGDAGTPENRRVVVSARKD